MMSLVHLISAKRRLKELEKTVTLLKHDKYNEDDVPVTVLAQRDFVKLEVEYYQDEVGNLLAYTLFAIGFLFLIGVASYPFLINYGVI
jgi:hypothetical protein